MPSNFSTSPVEFIPPPELEEEMFRGRPSFRIEPNGESSSRIIEIAETFGMEFETEFLTPGDMGSQKELKRYFRSTHDASIETDVYISQGGILLSKKSDDRALQYIGKSNFTIGTEFVSVILRASDPNLLDLIKNFTDFLGENGESPESYRSGIHFHISLPNPNIYILRAILKLGLSLESLFFRLGGMGYEFRGLRNDSVYCRPITKFGPPCVNSSLGGYTQCFNPYDILNSNLRTTEEFWERYGDLRNHRDRYNPIRYTWLNLYPMCPYSSEYKGTLEFRIFNKSLNPFFIYSTIQLCKKFVEYIVTNYKKIKLEDLEEHSIYSSISEGKMMELFFETMGRLEIDDPIVYILENIMRTTKTPTLPGEYVFSHLLSRRSLNNYWTNTSYHPERISEKINSPEFVDIHTLRGE